MQTFLRHYCAVFLLVIFASTSVHARADASTPQVRGQQMRDFVRLTFEWAQPTLFTAKTNGNDVILTFDRKTNPNMGAVLKKLHPYVVKAERKGDGRTIVLTLDKPHRIRTFVSDNISGIDLLDVKGGSKKDIKPLVAEKKTSTQKQAGKKKEQPSINQVAKAKDDSLKLAKLAPAAGETTLEKPAEKPADKPAEPIETSKEATAAEPAKAPVKPEEPVVAAKTESPKEEPIKEAVAKEELKKEEANQEEKPEALKDTKEIKKAEAAPVPTKAIDEKATPHAADRHDSGVSVAPMAVDSSEEISPEKASAEAKPEQPVKEEVSSPAASVEASQETEPPPPLTSNKIVVSADPEGATLRFPLKERTALATFIRGNVMWVVFDKKLDFDLSDFDSLPQTVINKPTRLEHNKATILQIPISDNIYSSIKQQEGQLDLAIILSTKEKKPDAAMPITINTDPPSPPNVFVPALEVGNTIEVNDPLIGDMLSITPFYTREQGIASRRGFVEFALLPSTQGLVIAKRADATEVTQLRNGLRISLPNKGAQLSPQLSGQADRAATVALPASGTLFPDELWALEKGKSYKLVMRKLFNETVFAPNEGAKNLARLRMAQIYLHDGFVVEALGLLDNINRSNPSYYRSAKLAAMHGAANFMLYRFNDAARDFGGAELNNNPEIAYWRDMIADLLGNPDKTYDYLAMDKNYISKYPAAFRQRLAIVAADRMIAAKEYNSALKIFDGLTKDKIIAPIQPYVDYLTAKISADNGQEQEAMDTWKRLAAESPNKFVQARATFSVILAEMDSSVLTRDQAMDKLERLRLGWHGDGLELQIVQLLGDLYFDKKDYVNAMRVWQIGVQGFKNTGPAIDMARKMEDTFTKLFSEGIADQMTPLEALALYYEYRNYSPTGVVGAQMIEKLADRLVGVDLLATASQLLEQQMRTQMEKSERSRVGAKLADIYLMNNQPKKALKVLQDSVYGDNPILLRIQRNQLTAQAMMRLNKPQEALTVLGQDESAGAEKIRALIYWEQKDWPNITNSIEAVFKKRPDPSAPLSAEEGEFAVRLALAYVFQNDTQQLQYMRDYFGPLMKRNPSKQAFDFITAPDVMLTTRNFDDLLQSLSKTRNFITTYKARLALADETPTPETTKQP